MKQPNVEPSVLQFSISLLGPFDEIWHRSHVASFAGAGQYPPLQPLWPVA
jgi:hypothetical protein